MNRLDYKTGKLYPDTLIWSTANRRLYTLMFEHYYQSRMINRDKIAWLDYIEGNKN